MMNKVTACVFSLLLSSAVAANGELPAGADAVVNAYFDALRAGDTQEIRRLLHPDMQRKLQKRLAHPGYGAELVKDNVDMTFTVYAHELLESGMYCVDYLGSDGNASIRKRLYISRAGAGDAAGFRIVEEQVLP